MLKLIEKEKKKRLKRNEGKETKIRKGWKKIDKHSILIYKFWAIITEDTEISTANLSNLIRKRIIPTTTAINQ